MSRIAFAVLAVLALAAGANAGRDLRQGEPGCEVHRSYCCDLYYHTSGLMTIARSDDGYRPIDLSLRQQT